jgi:uncharacterized membrane protein YedE/YeeE
MHDFTPLPALLGGALIGLAAALLLLADGRIAGISGILGGLLQGKAGWRLSFFSGLLLAGLCGAVASPTSLGRSPHSLAVLALAGVLVGVGTHFARGCTSGHGVCGIGRFSPRSIAATLAFMLTGIATVALFGVGAG